MSSEGNSEKTVGNGNLKPFQPGQSGNPKGRPRKLPELEELITEVLGEDEDGKSKAREILTALYKKALKGDVRASEILLDRAYGKVKQTINNTHSGAIQLIITPQDGNDPIPEA